MEIGDIFEIDTRGAGTNAPYGGIVFTVRVLLVSENLIMVDSRWDDESDWWFNKSYKSSFTFSKIPLYIFENYGKFLRNETIKSELLDALYFNLPIIVGRIKELSWTDKVFNDRCALKDFIKDYDVVSGKVENLYVKSIFLTPYTKNRVLKKPIKIEADNGKFFPIDELLWKAKILLSEVNKESSNGLGIFRTGVKSKIPEYYIGDYQGLSDIW